MIDPLEQLAASIAALVGRDPHDQPDTSLLVSTEALLTSVNQLHGVKLPMSAFTSR